MEDLHNIGSNEYKSATPLIRETKNVKAQVIAWLKISLQLLSILCYSYFKLFISLFSAIKPKCIKNQVALVIFSTFKIDV